MCGESGLDILSVDTNEEKKTDMNLLLIAKTRGTAHLPSVVAGQQWQGRGPGYHTRKTLVEIVTVLYPGSTLPKSMVKRQLVALIDSHQHLVAPPAQVPVPANEDCPFTQETLVAPVFVRTSSTGYHRGFSLEALADYLLSTGKAVDPIDREPIHQADLMRIDQQLRENGIHKGSVSAITSEQALLKYREAREQEETIEILRDCMDDVVDVIIADMRIFTQPPVAIVQSDFRSLYEYRRNARLLARRSVGEMFKFTTEAIAKCNDATLTDWARGYATSFLQQVAGEVMEHTETLPTMPLGSFIDDSQYVDDHDDDWDHGSSTELQANLVPLIERINGGEHRNDDTASILMALNNALVIMNNANANSSQ